MLILHQQSKKPINIVLKQVFGLSFHLSNQICYSIGINSNILAINLNKSHWDKISSIVQNNYFIESELKKLIQDDINCLSRIVCYRGIRHNMRLPLRGQRTRTNAKTSRKFLRK
jgi:small subunit ribosomal protein S13